MGKHAQVTVGYAVDSARCRSMVGGQTGAAAEEGAGRAPRPAAGSHGVGFRPAATAKEGAGRARHPGAASHGAGFRPAATAGVGRGWWSCAAGREKGGRVRVALAPGGRPGIIGNPLNWVNTDGEGGEGRPVHRDVAPVTWGRASWGGSGRPAL